MLIDAYDLVAAAPRLARLKFKSFGDESVLNQPGACPRMIWIPTVDTFGPPDSLARQEGFHEGRRAIFTSRFLRAAGCRIHLFTDFGPQGQRDMEALINDLVMALYDELEAPGMNFALGNAEWTVRDAESVRSIEVIQTITVGVPIWDTQPAQLLKTVDTAGSRIQARDVAGTPT